ncbi:MAG: DNA gyrase inhibitor YacG [Planctomycetota bacterium]
MSDSLAPGGGPMCPETWRVRCPNCGKEVVRASGSDPDFFPFCSERCKLIDLGRWFDEEHRIEEPLEGGAGDRSGEGEES